MKKYLLICMLFISNAFGYESYYEKLDDFEKIAVDMTVKSCVNGALSKQETITDKDIKEVKLYCQEMMACIQTNFGMLQEPTDAQMQYCFDKIKEIVK